MRESILIAVIGEHGIEYVKTDDGFISKFKDSVFMYKGSINSIEELADIDNPEIGDVYHINGTNAEYVYTEHGWEYLGAVVDISGKRDKSEFSNDPPTWTDPTSFISDDPETANKHRILAGVYAVDEKGNQIIIPFSMAGGARVDGEPEGSETDPNGTPLGIPTFVVYNRGNQILCCKATNPKHAVPLGQLQDILTGLQSTIAQALAGKLDKAAATSANGRKLYGTASTGAPYMYKVLRSVAEMQSSDGGVLGRPDNGQFVVPEPTAKDHIANKGYVDNEVKKAGGPTWVSAPYGSTTITVKADTYRTVTCLYRGYGSADNYDTSTIVIGPDVAYSIQYRGTTDGQGRYVSTSGTDYDIDTFDLVIHAPSGSSFVGYFIN